MGWRIQKSLSIWIQGTYLSLGRTERTQVEKHWIPLALVHFPEVRTRLCGQDILQTHSGSLTDRNTERQMSNGQQHSHSGHGNVDVGEDLRCSSKPALGMLMDPPQIKFTMQWPLYFNKTLPSVFITHSHNIFICCLSILTFNLYINLWPRCSHL